MMEFSLINASKVLMDRDEERIALNQIEALKQQRE